MYGGSKRSHVLNTSLIQYPLGENECQFFFWIFWHQKKVAPGISLDRYWSNWRLLAKNRFVVSQLASPMLCYLLFISTSHFPVNASNVQLHATAEETGAWWPHNFFGKKSSILKYIFGWKTGKFKYTFHKKFNYNLKIK